MIDARRLRPSFVVYLNNIVGIPMTGRCAEVGVSCGYNAHSMLTHSKVSLVLVDDYKNFIECPDAEERAMKLLEPHKDRIDFIKESSVEAAKQFNDDYFDYVYIDAGHEYEDVKSDIEAWYPKVTLGGMIAGHDFWKKDVKDAVIGFFSDSFISGVDIYSDIAKPMPSNIAMMCDWWVYKGVR